MNPELKLFSYESNVVVIQAVKITDENYEDIALYCGGTKGWSEVDGRDEPAVNIPTLEGEFTAPVGWWFIEGTEGEHYACKDSVFRKKYHKYEGMLKDIELKTPYTAPPSVILEITANWLDANIKYNPHISLLELTSMLRRQARDRQAEELQQADETPLTGKVEELEVELDEISDAPQQVTNIFADQYIINHFYGKDEN